VRRKPNYLVVVLSTLVGTMCVACSLVTSLDGLTGGDSRGAGVDDGGDADGGLRGVVPGDAAGLADTSHPETQSNDTGADAGPSCPQGSTLCEGSCVDTATDTVNCGTCGNACLVSAGQSCVAGGCAPGAFLLIDSAGYALDDPAGAPAGTGIDQVAYLGPNPNQEWMVSLAGPGQYKVLAANGLALTGPSADCGQAALASYTQAPEQLWVLEVNGGQTSLVNVASGNALDDESGGQGQQIATCSLGNGGPDTNQMWFLSPVLNVPPIPDGAYAFIDAAGFALDDPGSGGVDQTHDTGEGQQWTVTLVGGIQYKILSSSGAALTGDTTNAALTVASYTGAGDQLWVFQQNGTGYSVLNVQTGQAIDENNGGGLDISVESWSFDEGNGNQVWSLARVVPNGSYALFDEVGFALDAPESADDAGTIPDQSAYAGDNQQWTVKNVGGTLYEIASASGDALTSGMGNGTIAAVSSYTGAVNQLWSFAPAAGGYAVVNAGTGLVLDSNGGGEGTSCNEWQWGGAPNQTWTLTPSSAVAPPLADGAYVFAAAAGFTLDDPGGAAVSPDQVPYSGPDQTWTVTRVNGPEYKVLGAGGYALTSGTTSGTLAPLSSYTGADTQLWIFAPLGGGTYSVVNAGTGLLLDDNGGNPASGTVANQWQWATTTHQMWTVTAASEVAPPVANGVYHFIDAPGFALDDPGSEEAGAASPDQVPYSGTAQDWTVTLVSGFEYKIISPNGAALTSGTSNGLLAAPSSYTGAVDQLWTFVSAGGGSYHVVNVGTGLVLDDNSGGAGVSCNQWGWQPNSAPNQNWTLVSN
jgi:hypothetical protein